MKSSINFTNICKLSRSNNTPCCSPLNSMYQVCPCYQKIQMALESMNYLSITMIIFQKWCDNHMARRSKSPTSAWYGVHLNKTTTEYFS